MFGEKRMEAVIERRTMFDALHQVRVNKGSPGADGMTVDALPDFLKGHWPRIKEQLIQGTYQPQVVKRVEMPKPGRPDTRKVGIPCVLERLIQHAMLHILQRPWDPTVSEWLLLDSRVVDVPMAYNPTFVTLSSLKPFFFNGLQNE